MVQVSVKVGHEVDYVKKRLQSFAGMLPGVAKTECKRTMREVSDKMHEPGDVPTYPIKWVSEKQRRAFFATNGFGGGIPHKRTGKYQAGWQLQELPGGYKLLNNTNAAKHVGGNAKGLYQSPIHAGRWNKLEDALDNEKIDELPKRIETEIIKEAKRQGLYR